jgi:hypothetical protein
MPFKFLIAWLLCSVAFSVCHQPTDTPSTLKMILAGVLVAIAICLVPLALN